MREKFCRLPSPSSGAHPRPTGAPARARRWSLPAGTRRSSSTATGSGEAAMRGRSSSPAGPRRSHVRLMGHTWPEQLPRRAAAQPLGPAEQPSEKARMAVVMARRGRGGARLRGRGCGPSSRRSALARWWQRSISWSSRLPSGGRLVGIMDDGDVSWCLFAAS